jgi:mono/diheme cytochrome c family protein
MNKKSLPLVIVAVVLLALLYWVFGVPSVGNPEIPTDAASIARGAYIYNAGGCGACHQPDGAEAAVGGYRIEVETPVAGTYIVPNITPDPETGVGGWTGRDFLLALKHGRSPGGGFYWPAFPYRTYMDMSDEDVLDLAAYIMSMEPVNMQQPDHELPAWQLRIGMAGWNFLADFMEGDYPAVPENAQVQRGAYLARAMGHCTECHTPRSGLMMLQKSQEFGGSDIIKYAITPDNLASDDWTQEGMVYFLQSGEKPNFDYVGGEMADVIEHTSQLSLEDQQAYAAFLLRGHE